MCGFQVYFQFHSIITGFATKSVIWIWTGITEWRKKQINTSSQVHAEFTFTELLTVPMADNNKSNNLKEQNDAAMCFFWNIIIYLCSASTSRLKNRIKTCVTLYISMVLHEHDQIHINSLHKINTIRWIKNKKQTHQLFIISFEMRRKKEGNSKTSPWK